MEATVLKIREKFQSDGVLTAKTLFGSRLWSKQEEVIRSVWKNKYTAVKSGNSVGKSHISAQVALAYLASFYPSKVITTAPTFTQVENILWKEIASLYKKSKIPFGGDLLKTELRLAPEWFAIGISTNEVNRFQGFHSPYLLVVIDEALGVDPIIWEAIEGLHPHRVLAIGNPLEPTGNFFDCFSSPLWNKITISCEDCVKWQKEHGQIPGLVTQEWINEREEEWGRGSPLFQARVLGEFPDESEDTLISRRWVDEARHRVIEEDLEEFGPRVEAVDVATKHGKCHTVFTYRYGHTIAEIKGYRGLRITDTRNILQRDYHQKQLTNLVIDADGVGEGLDDMLYERNIPFMPFHGGHGDKAIDSLRYKNLRSQFWCIVAKKFERGLYSLAKLDDKTFEILKNQLCSVRMKPPDPKGRIQIETKEDLQARGIKSPDYADSFVYAEYGFWSDRFSDIKPYRYR